MDPHANRALIRTDDALRIGLAIVWCIEGLVPKILFLRPAELGAFASASFVQIDPSWIVPLLGGVEVLLGLLLFLGVTVVPVLWAMLALLSIFTADLLIVRPDLLLDPFGGLIKNAGLLSATAALLSLRGEAFGPLLRLVSRLRWDLLNEIGADVVYREQARAARETGLRETLEAFARTEREHASALGDALGRVGARAPILGGPVALVSTVLGWLLARLGDRRMLAFDLRIETLAVRSYAASAEQFAAWNEDLLAAEFRLMAAEEDDHARRIRDLLAGLAATRAS
jgi:rubrerythrin